MLPLQTDARYLRAIHRWNFCAAIELNDIICTGSDRENGGSPETQIRARGTGTCDVREVVRRLHVA